MITRSPTPHGDLWTSSRYSGAYCLYDQRRLRRACTYTQSRQNLCCWHMQSTYRLVDECADKIGHFREGFIFAKLRRWKFCRNIFLFYSFFFFYIISWDIWVMLLSFSSLKFNEESGLQLFKIAQPHQICETRLIIVLSICHKAVPRENMFSGFATNLQKLEISAGVFSQWHLLVAYANSLNPDQVRQNVGPDPDQKLLVTLMVYSDFFFFENDYFEENQQTTKTWKIDAACQEFNYNYNEGTD